MDFSVHGRKDLGSPRFYILDMSLRSHISPLFFLSDGDMFVLL